MQLSPRVEEAVINEMRRLLHEHRRNQHTIHTYENATNKSKTELIAEGGGGRWKRRDHLVKVNGSRQSITDVAAQDSRSAAPHERNRKASQGLRRGSVPFAANHRRRPGQEPSGQEGVDRSQLAPGGEPWASSYTNRGLGFPRPDSGRQHRPDARGQ